jgi:hypothetical protein
MRNTWQAGSLSSFSDSLSASRVSVLKHFYNPTVLQHHKYKIILRFSLVNTHLLNIKPPNGTMRYSDLASFPTAFIGGQH